MEPLMEPKGDILTQKNLNKLIYNELRFNFCGPTWA